MESCANILEKQVLMNRHPVQRGHQVRGTKEDYVILMGHLTVEFIAGNLVGTVRTFSCVAE
jgi:hypothetical protein